MKKHKKLTKGERFELAILKGKRYSSREIGKVMERSPSTISRELRRNVLKKTGEYVPLKAHHKSYVRKKYSRFEWKKINHNKELKEFIIESLKKHWNPDEISGYMKANNLPFYASKTAVYEWLYSTQGSPYCKYLYSKRYAKKRRKKKTKRDMIPNRVGIERRSVSANDRSRYGHLEADTLVSGKSGSGAILVAIDRKSRYVRLEKLTSLKPQETVDTLKGITKEMSALSMTLDNGIENKYHQQLSVSTYFCNPYSSWQKGSVENVNKMIRRYIPKGTSISKVPESYTKLVEEKINKKPRKILGYKSAYDVMVKRRLLGTSVAIQG
jgi:transposase, IS30 family